MLFNSTQFLFFFVIVTILYFQLPFKFRALLLLLASCYFYMFFIPIYILVLGGTIVVDYFAGILLEKSHGHKRKSILIVSILANVGILVIFKYSRFITYNINQILDIFKVKTHIPYLSLLLPLGLSFHTFQAMSYTIEVYRGNQKAEKNFMIYALYVMFYPQLVAGPIERPQNMLHQFHDRHFFNYDRFKHGLMIMAFGFLKKVVIADRLALVVDNSFKHIDKMNGPTMIVVMFFYAFQIYCDFSGYSEIALGAAEVMGFKLMVNFRSPYMAKSISEFWSRWHISLSTWFRDYLYIPLGGNRVSKKRWQLNIIIVFLLSGFWHGANWTFIVWGCLHAIFFISQDKIQLMKILKIDVRIKKVISVCITFGLVSFAWIFFRSINVSQAFTVISKIVNTRLGQSVSFAINGIEIWLCFALILLLILKEKYYPVIKTNGNLSYYLKLLFLVFIIYFLGVFNQKQFIYFQF